MTQTDAEAKSPSQAPKSRALVTALTGAEAKSPSLVPKPKALVTEASWSARPLPNVADLSERRGSDIVSLISSEPENTFSEFVGDLDAVLSRNHLRLLPILGRGTLHNVNDLLYTRGIDIAVVQADAIRALDHPARRRLRYIAKLYNEQFHVVAGREITDVRQLEGRKVNIDKPGTGTYLTARNVFKRLKVSPEFTTDDQATAYRKLSAGEIAAAVYVARRPARELGAFENDSRFHLIPVKYQDEIAGDYVPSELGPSHYPSLIESGTKVETIAVANVLAVLNWPERSERYRRLARFVSAFLSRYDSSLMHGRSSSWDEGIPSARVPGWQRFRPAKEWLDRKALAPFPGTSGT
jgi:TRAP-type uncharacterized transport system substrate-binding protein